jgi:hypothetical protein
VVPSGLVFVKLITFMNNPLNPKRYYDTDWYDTTRLSSFKNSLQILLSRESSRYTHVCLKVNFVSVLGPLLLVPEWNLLLSDHPHTSIYWLTWLLTDLTARIRTFIEWQFVTVGHSICTFIVLYAYKGHAGSLLEEVFGVFNWFNPSSRTMTLGSTQPLTEMSTRNLPGRKGRPACMADNFTAICEPTV